MIDKVYKEVEKLLASDNSGMDHINRVVKLACIFADSEGANKDIIITNYLGKQILLMLKKS